MKTISNTMLGAAGVPEIVFTVLFALFSVITVLVAVWLIAKFLPKKKVSAQSVSPSAGESSAKDASAESGDAAGAPPAQLNFTAVMGTILIIGLIVRLIFAFVVRGNLTDFNAFINLFDSVTKNGFAGNYYTAYGIGNIYPLAYIVFGGMGALASLFGADISSAAMPLFVKLPMIICDLATAYLMYRAARKYINGYVALTVCAFVCVCPVFVFASSVWGSLYSVLALLLALVMYFIAQKNFIGIIGTYAAAMLVMPDALYLFPVVAVYVIYNFAAAVRCLKKTRLQGIKEITKNSECAGVITIPAAVIASGILMYLVSLPSIIGSVGAGYFTWLYRFFLHPLGNMASFGRDSLGIFNIFVRNGVALDPEFPTVVFSVIFGVIVTGIVLLIYLSKKNRANLVFLGGYVLFTMATYFVNFSALSLLPVLAMFLLSYLFIRDKRMLQIFGVLSLVVTLNACFALCGNGYLTSSSTVVASTDVLNSGAGLVGNIICSVLAVLTHLYATIVLLDISMSSKRKLLPESERIGFLAAMRGFFGIK